MHTEATVDKELKWLIKGRLFPSLDDGLWFFLLIGKFHDEVGVHFKNTDLSIDCGIGNSDFEFTCNCIDANRSCSFFLSRPTTHSGFYCFRKYY